MSEIINNTDEPLASEMIDEIKRTSSRISKPNVRADEIINHFFTSSDGPHPFDEVTWITRDAAIKNADGEAIFEQKDIEVPAFWTERATQIVAEKYFRGAPGLKKSDGYLERETSIRQMISRIVEWYTASGKEQDYFKTVEEEMAFERELSYILVNQYASFNSPVWFNVGVREKPYVAACFLNPVEDNMESILNLGVVEGRLFSHGSGTGTNLSTLRGSTERLSGGGFSSGPVSFLKGYDSWAGIIKSGGRCLAPTTYVYTDQGPIQVQDLANADRRFVCFSYDPPAGRVKAKWATAWKSKDKEVVRIHTDKGQFDLSIDHPVFTADFQVMKAGDLRPGMSLLKTTVGDNQGYLRMGLRDGMNGRKLVHRLIAEDLLDADDEQIVHHKDGNPRNNDIANLMLTTQSWHAKHHGEEVVATGEHVFQKESFRHDGDHNGMHSSSDFWKDDDRVEEYKEKQRSNMNPYRAKSMQNESARSKMLNLLFKLLNAGYEIESFDDYIKARENLVGRVGDKRKVLRSIEDRFGTFEAFIEEALVCNHRVLQIESLGVMPTYSVEVDCPTPDDKTPQSGHNFLIWSDDSLQGSGIFVFNTRRAAKMNILNDDHPDIEDFVTCKAEEERKARTLIEAGYDESMDGDAYSSVRFQNENLSVWASDEFLRAVENDEDWDLNFVKMDGVSKTVKARDLWKKICESAWECADPGLCFKDTINHWHTCPECGPITTSNPCFPGNTRILTAEGYIPIDEIVQRASDGEETTVLRRDGSYSNLSQYLITGYNPILEIRLSDGRVLQTTPNHNWILSDGSRVRADELQIGDSIHVLSKMVEWAGSVSFPVSIQTDDYRAKRDRTDFTLPTEWTEDFAHILGVLVGDGFISPDRGTVGFIFGTDEVEHLRARNMAERLRAIFSCTIHETETDSGCKTVRMTRNPIARFLRALGCEDQGSVHKRIPHTLWKAPPGILASFIAGYFDADGTIYGREDQGELAIAASSVSEELLQDVQLALGLFGIRASISQTREAGTKRFRYTTVEGEDREYECKATYRLLICPEDHESFRNYIGFRHPLKNDRLQTLSNSRSTIKSKWQDPKVIAVESIGSDLTFNITEPNDHAVWAEGIYIAQCGEVVHNDGTACNLASINLMKFLREDGSWDREAFRHVVRVLITAMDISVSVAGYPSKLNTKMANDHRPLGLGFANLGALLMSKGLPYDSKDGRHLAAKITALMTGEAYLTSAKIAKRIGAFSCYQSNEEAVLGVLEKHLIAALKLEDDSLDDLWNETVKCAGEFGVRNSQVTVLAPTGTISFMMDCDTTGIEPDFALVKIKRLSGKDGVMKMVNRSVPRALTTLGYSEEDISWITKYIEDFGTVEGCDRVKPEHVAVFDCAVAGPCHLCKGSGCPACGETGRGKRSIRPEGHVDIVAAVTPFLSGSCSKTVNLPETVSPQDIGQIYLRAWKKGMKNISIYRDGSKGGQPLSVGASGKKAISPGKPDRLRLPDEFEHGRRKKVQIGEFKGYIHTGEYPDGALGEIFLRFAKQGSTLDGLANALAVSVSIGLQHGVPLSAYVEQFLHTDFEPRGMTKDPEVPFATSVLDYVFRWLGSRYLKEGARPEDQIVVDDFEENRSGNGSLPDGWSKSGPPCPNCGSVMIRSGSCHCCMNCGRSNGCSG